MSPPIIIKPDLIPEQKAQEALLLKQRWQLMQSGISRKAIRIPGNKLYVNNYIHGQIINLEYCVSPSSNYVAPASKIPSALMSNDSVTTSSSFQLSTAPSSSQLITAPSSSQLGTAPCSSQLVTTPSFSQPAVSSN